MTFEVIIHQKAARQIRDLPEPQQKLIIRLLDRLESTAIPFTEFDIKKIKGKAHTYRVRFGDYRLIYEIIKKENKIQVLKLEPRKKVYK
jgi:mRNA interferase RelE/StbE